MLRKESLAFGIIHRVCCATFLQLIRGPKPHTNHGTAFPNKELVVKMPAARRGRDLLPYDADRRLAAAVCGASQQLAASAFVEVEEKVLELSLAGDDQMDEVEC